MPWIGFVIVLLGALSYFMVFAMYPATRDFAWVNLPVVVLGLVVAIFGIRGWRRRTGRGQVITVTFGALSVVLAAWFVYYLFHFTYQVPSPTTTATELEQPLGFTLPDHHGNPVSLDDYQGRRLVISFFRGSW